MDSAAVVDLMAISPGVMEQELHIARALCHADRVTPAIIRAVIASGQTRHGVSTARRHRQEVFGIDGGEGNHPRESVTAIEGGSSVFEDFDLLECVHVDEVTADVVGTSKGELIRLTDAVHCHEDTVAVQTTNVDAGVSGPRVCSRACTTHAKWNADTGFVTRIIAHARAF